MKQSKIIVLICLQILLVSVFIVAFDVQVQVSAAAPIFADGFENNNFNAWKMTEGQTTLTTTVTNSGTYAANTIGSGSDLLYTLSITQSTLYVRGYFRFPALPTNNKEETVIMIMDSNWNVLGTCGIANWGGTYYWRSASPPNYYNTAATIKVDTWYSVELRITAGTSGTGIITMWINGVQIQSSTTENINGNAKYVKVGTVFANDPAYQLYSDDYVIGTTYTGPNTAAPIFADGFENNNFNAWKMTEGQTTLTTTVTNSGTYAANTIGSGSDLLYTLSITQSTLYVRGYFRFPALPTNNKEETVIMIMDSNWNVLGTCGIANWGGTYYWRSASPPNYYNTAATIKVDTWYSVELRITAGTSGTGIITMWINGVQIQSSTTENINGNAKYVKVGTVFANDPAYQLYSDDYVIGTTYTGPNVATPPPTSTPTPTPTPTATPTPTPTATPTPKPTATPTPKPTATPTPTPTPSGFIIKAADTPLDVIKPGNVAYEANWASSLKGTLGVNTLRLTTGGGGDVWGINMIRNPTTWATNLESLLSTINAGGFKCYFYSLGDPFGGELGINDQPERAGIPYISSVISIAQAKVYIDQLAGNNSLNHNFITDPRIAVWSVANEVGFGSSSSLNSNYNWVTQICDYIRSKGGLVVVPNPIIDGQFTTGQSVLAGHVDFLEYHQYGVWQLPNQFSLGGTNYNWAAWKAWLQSDLAAQIANRGTFDMNHFILGEFGIWRGTGSMFALNGYTFTDQNRIDYYTNYFAVINSVGLKNVCFHYSIEENTYYSATNFPRFGMITPAPDGIHFSGPAGQPYPGSEVIKANFG